MRRSHRSWRVAVGLLAATAVALGVSPSVAWAHAQLESTSPANNAVVSREPSVISLTFGESVGINGDAVRVFDRGGRQVDTGGTFHPGGMATIVGVRLRPGLPDGSYTATYRVVSADTHIVTGAFVFSIGSRGARGTAALGTPVAGGGSGGVSNTAFAAARAVQYAAIGIAAGLFVFLLLIWPVALERAGPGAHTRRAASTRYLLLTRAILLGCCVAGALSALVAIALQGAEARGVDFWQAIGPTTLSDVLPTRFGIVWGAGFVAWLLVLIALLGPLAQDWIDGLLTRPWTTGATARPRTRGASARPGTPGATAQPATVGATASAMPPARTRWAPLAPLARGWAARLIAWPATLGTTSVPLPRARTRWPLTAIGVPLAVARVRARAGRDRERERNPLGIVRGAVFVAGLLVLSAPVAPLARGWAARLIPQPATPGAPAQPSTLDTTGVALPSARTRWPVAVIGVPLAALLLLPAFAGHATIQHPVALFAPINVIHVSATAVWLGGLVGLLTLALTLPRDNSDPAVGTRTLAAALVRFSPIALGCVVVLIATGVVQALIEVSAWSQFVDTGYGRALIVKIVALTVLIALGARQRRRSIPAVSAAARASAPAAGSARLLVQTLGAELAMLVVVLAAVGSLAGSAPARDQAATSAAGNGTTTSGPGHGAATSGSGNGAATSGSGGGAATSATGHHLMSQAQMWGMAMGPGVPVLTATVVGNARIDISVAPGTVGRNTVALTMVDQRTGRLFTASKQLTVTATQTEKHIGPLNLPVHQTRPGHYATAPVVLGAQGIWTLQITDRTSEFDQSQSTVAVPIN